MSFKTQDYLQAQFRSRQEDVSVPDLKHFFDEDDKPIWKVRGLTGQELAQCNSAVERNRNISAILEGIASNQVEGIKEAIAKLSGQGVPDAIAKRVQMLVLGSVDPKVDESLAVHFCTNNPIEFYQLTNVITKLTGLGFDSGKSQISGTTTA